MFQFDFYGHVEVYIASAPYRVCAPSSQPTYWDHTEATVACQEWGYSLGRAVNSYGTYNGPAMVTIDCTGSEAYLGHCPQQTVDSSLCSNVTVAALVCTNQVSSSINGNNCVIPKIPNS